MKTINDLTNAQKLVALDYFAKGEGYNEVVADLDENGNEQFDEFGVVISKPNPETKAQFLTRKQNEWAYERAKIHYLNEKARLAREEAEADL